MDVEELRMDRSDSLSLDRPRLAWLPTLRCAALPFPPALLSCLLPATNHSPLATLAVADAVPLLRSLNLTYSTLHFGASAPKKIYLPLTVQRRLTNTCMPRRECCPHKTRVSKPNVFLSMLVSLSKTSIYLWLLQGPLVLSLCRSLPNILACSLPPLPSAIPETRRHLRIPTCTGNHLFHSFGTKVFQKDTRHLLQTS